MCREWFCAATRDRLQTDFRTPGLILALYTGFFLFTFFSKSVIVSDRKIEQRKVGSMAKKKKRCSHKGRIAKRLKPGQIHCYKVAGKVTLMVGSGTNMCMHPTCPFARVPIPQQDVD